MRLIFSKQPRRPPLRNRRLLLKIIKHAARLTGLEEAADQTDNGCELHIVIVDEQTITRMNEQYLSHSGATDVLAFDLHSDSPVLPACPVYGEVYVSLDAAAAAAKDYDTTLAYELVLYIVHGMLHLAGYGDHEEDDRREMRSAEQRVLDDLRQASDFGDVL